MTRVPYSGAANKALGIGTVRKEAVNPLVADMRCDSALTEVDIHPKPGQDRPTVR